MKKTFKALIALCLSLCLLLSGCGLINLGGYFEQLGNLLGSNFLTPFDEMEYTRPDMDHFQQVLENSLSEAQTQQDLDALVESIYAFYAVFDDFYTGYALSNIHYSKNLTDSYWEAEYNFCTENMASVDAGLDSLYRALSKSPLREQLETEDYFGPGYFDAYEGETLYDETFQAMLEQEAQLQNRYYAISAQAGAEDYYSDAYFTTYGSQMADIYVQLIALRQQMAQYAGYESFPEFAYDFYYGRDYTCQATESYLQSIQQELAPLYRQTFATDDWADQIRACTEQETFQYVKSMASAMGGTIEDAFLAMEEGGLYDITYSDQKFNASFEIFINNYATPYVFLCPTGTNYDCLTFAHEFGHFCSDYASYGSIAGIDVAEVFSQGMEYLSLSYVPSAELTKLKMADCLRVYVEQAAYASFEQQVYRLQGEDLTAENIQSLYQQVCTDFGMDRPGWDSRDYVCIPHFYVSPMYVISYVVSNDLALQLYEMEKAQQGRGLACLEDNLATMQSGLEAFVQETQTLTSPFAPGHLTQVKDLLTQLLQ